MKKLVSILFALLIVCSILSVPVSAKEANLTNLSEDQNIIIVLTYDTEEPTYTIVSPSGQKYSKDSDFAEAEHGDSAVYLFLKNAEAGQWTITYNKKTNKTLNASVYPWDCSLTVSNITFGNVVENRLDVSANITCEKETDFNYTAYAVASDADGNETSSAEIASGRGYTGDTLEFTADTTDLIDGKYAIRLQVSYTNSQNIEIPTYLVTDKKFTVSGNVAQSDEKGLVSVLNLTDSVLTLDWSSIAEGVRGWTLDYYTTQGGSTPVNTVNYEAEETNDRFLFNAADGDIKVVLTGTTDQNQFIKVERSVKMTSGITAEFVTTEKTNTSQGTIHYDCGSETVFARITINGKSKDLSLTSANNLSFTLDSGVVNEVSFRYGIAEGNYYQISQRITVDDTPPVLDLYGFDDHATVTTSKLQLSGYTESGSSLTVNGNAVTVGDDGNFVAELTLAAGNNSLVFVSADASGNKTSRTLTVNYSASGTVFSDSLDQMGFRFPIPLIAALVMFAVILFFMWLFGKGDFGIFAARGLGKNTFLYRVVIILKALVLGIAVDSLALAGCLLYTRQTLMGKITGKNLLNESADSVETIHNVANAYMKFIIIFGVAAVVLIAAFVGLQILSGRLKGKLFARICPGCGHVIEKAVEFCPDCGTRKCTLKEAKKCKIPKERKTSTPKPKKEKKPKQKKS